MCDTQTLGKNAPMIGMMGLGPWALSGLAKSQNQSPMGAPQGTQSPEPPDMGQPNWMGGMSPTSSLGGASKPSDPRTWQQRMMGGIKGASRGMQNARAMAPQQNMSYRPQQYQQAEQQPITNGLLDSYLRQQLSGQGVTY